jgi:hypothetical protein
MKRSVFYIIIAALLFGPNVTFALIIEDGYTPGLTLDDYETLLMTGGGVGSLNLEDNSSATIIGTSPLEQFSGGIWYMTLVGYSTLDFSGGEVHEIAIASYATATLSGGRIDNIYSQQFAWIQEGDPPVWVPNPHITMVCDIESVFHNTQTNLLTGDWLDGSSFSIQLVDVDGYSPAIENILFIPEPATIILLALGAALIKRKR